MKLSESLAADKPILLNPRRESSHSPRLSQRQGNKRSSGKGSTRTCSSIFSEESRISNEIFMENHIKAQLCNYPRNERESHKRKAKQARNQFR